MRNVGQNRGRLGTDPIRGDGVVYELHSRCRILDRLRTKITSALCVTGNGTVEDKALTKALPFKIEKEEGAVLPIIDMRNSQRAAEVATELIALEDLARQGEEVSSIELVIADELEEASMKAVCSTLDRCIEESAAAIVFRRVRALLNRELSKSVD